MTSSRSLLRNSVIHAISSGSALLLFVLLFLAGRWLGAEDFGRFSFALAFVFLFDFFFDPGLYHLLIREIARNPAAAARYLSHTLTWKLGISPIAILVVGISVALLHESEVTRHCVALMVFGHVFHTMKEGLRAGLLGGERFDLDAVVLISERTLLLLGGVGVLLAEWGVVALCAVFLVVRAVTFVLALVLARRSVAPFGLGFEWGFLRAMIVTAIPMGAFYVTLNLYNYVDTVMLSAIRDDTEVGWYNAGYRVYEGTLIVAAIIGTVFMPRLSRLHHEDRDAFRGLLGRGFKYVFVLGMLVSANGLLLAEPIITIPFGAEYAKAVPAFEVLLCALPAVYSVHFLQMSLIAMDRQNVILVFAVLGLAVNVGLNAVLIPIHGYEGAAVATALVEGMLMLLLLGFMPWSGVRLPWGSAVLRPALLMAVLVLIANRGVGDAPVLVSLLVVNVGFAVIAWLPVVGILEPDERAVALRLLRRPFGM